MNALAITLLFAFSAAAFGRSMTNEDLLAWLQEHSVTTEIMAEQFSELRDFVSSQVEERLVNIEELLQAMTKRQQLHIYCTPGPCGDHGECHVPEDGTDGFECDCEQPWTGQFCNETGPCHQEYVEIESLPAMPGMEIPRCDEEGFYLGMQYRGSVAHCVDRQGEPLRPYAVQRWLLTEDMTCDCARAEFEHFSEAGETSPGVFNCTKEGSYAIPLDSE